MSQRNLRIVAFASGLLLAGLVMGLPEAFGAEGDDELLSILGSGAGAPAAAAKPGAQPELSAFRKVIGKPSAEQNIFLSFIEKGEMEKALFQWPTAFESTPFARSPSGRALNAFLLYKNGIKVTALESLLSIDRPEQINPEMLKLWKEAAPDNDPVWGLVSVATWKPLWTETFGLASEIRVRSRQIYGTEKLDALKELIKKTQADTRERAWLSWQLVLALSTGDDPGTAAKALAVLMKAPNNPVSEDLMTITAARLLYQNGFLDAAAKYYQKVPKSSDYWFDAQEELGWSFIRKGEPQNAIAVTKTLTNEAFASQVGPEPLFLRSLAQLKVCDYPEVVKTLNTFRDRYRDRAKALMAVSESADTPAVKNFIARSKGERVSLMALGKEATELPRFVTRDEVLAGLVETEKALEKEGKQAGELYARSLTGGTGQVGFQARLEDFKKAVETRVAGARSATYNRVKELSSEEVNEIAQILQKLHIVEAELLQQISLADRVAGATATQKIAVRSGSTGSQAQDKIVFPAEQETWFDELSNYKVDIKRGCQSAKR
ncbi:MAG: hypothetical protein AAB250_17850 [Bdellovibrionota bacterium]